MSIGVPVGAVVDVRLLRLDDGREEWVPGWVTEVADGKVTLYSPFNREKRVYPDPSPDWRLADESTPSRAP